MYEGPFQPNTGSRLREMLFEPYDVFLGEDLKEEIKNVVARFEPRVVLNDVRITPGDDDNTLDIEVDYTIVGETLVQTVDFLLENLTDGSNPFKFNISGLYRDQRSIGRILRTRTEFTDYDFEGSAASYLLDVLAYNTYYAAFNANMAMNEAFLESATIRDNVVKIVKQQLYTKIHQASKACLHFAVQTQYIGSSTTFPSTVTLPQGDTFVSSVDGESFLFTLPQDLTVAVDQTTGIAEFNKTVVYQGNLLTYKYTVEDVKKRGYDIPVDNVDADLLYGSISPNAQSEEIDTYNRITDIVGVDGTTRGYFSKRLVT